LDKGKNTDKRKKARGEKLAVDETNYWKDLEFRVCGELAALPQKQLRFLWCDGFIPDQYILVGPSPRITGKAWIGNGRTQELWEFTLFLNYTVGSRSDIEWDTLLPPENVTHWLAIDPHRKRLEIEPSAAVGDAT
jgi:hypothetical protein